ncbi:hypothetical protein G6X41_04775, partial [Staphylococcus aureus]|nr:hypothetical protein [Staphylococcus aureus]
MNGAQWVVHALRTQGVDTVFGYPGGAIMPVYDALYDGGVEHLLGRHEQEAARADIGSGGATVEPGVGIAQPGPAAASVTTGARGPPVGPRGPGAPPPPGPPPP